MSHAPTLPHRAPRLMLPAAPVLVAEAGGIYALTPEGEIKALTDDEARMLVRRHMPFTCHGPALAKRLRMERFHSYDVLELFAFVHPGAFTVPTVRGLARALHLLEPDSGEDLCLSLRDAARHLLADLQAQADDAKPAREMAAIAAMMGMTDIANDAEGEKGWPWALPVLAALGRETNPPGRAEMRAAMRLWDRLPEWAQHAPEPPAGHESVSAAEAEDRLHKLLLRQKKEDRPQQQAYTAGLTPAFAPRDSRDSTHVVLAEAGTGVGKTLGYLAPATVWAEKNAGPVWISTYTRNLQRQVESELERLYDDPVTRARKVVTRKGRENYLCLLNLEDAAQSQSLMTNDLNATALGLMLRWAGTTTDGDMAGRDFPGWLPGVVGWNRVYSLADRRGECIYSACPHFDKCFIEKSVRKAKRADIVIANHALVMHQAAVVGPDDALPTRYVFDEGHHIFDAADSAFCAHLNGTETADLRRWLLGAETQNKSRARGVKRRLEDLIAGDEAALRDVEDLIEASRCLPGPGWRQRIAEGQPKGMTESFLSLCREQVIARNKDNASSYAIETEARPPVPGLFEAAYALSLRLNDIKRPLLSLAAFLRRRLEDDAETLSTADRERLTFMAQSLERRAKQTLSGWIEMLQGLRAEPVPGFVDWLEVSRIDGREDDAGFYRYALDPAAIFGAQIKPHAQGLVVTSATLRDTTPDDPDGWQSPLVRSGVLGLSDDKPKTFHVASPFDYAAQTRIIVLRDVNKQDAGQVAAAFRVLFTAADGGALGIFTAVQRLKAVHHKLAPDLAAANIPLLAQHVDPLDAGTLIDIFRQEENACLLGTDATRDGIDVPGRSLRLVVYDRVPWPRPTILHKARRNHFGRGYDDMLTRFKLKQAYGRLIRTAQDKGVFVMLDGALPTRLTTAFPDGVAVERIGLAEAASAIKDFLKDPNG